MGVVHVPDAYQGREQSYLKHRVLEEYLLGWGHKLGSVAQRRRVRLCYVDGFAGPWNSKRKGLEDTSIAIALLALEAAAKTWQDRGAQIDVDAAFVEDKPTAFAELKRFLKGRSGTVRTVAYQGEFGTYVPELKKWLGTDAALIFVDPTGWKGAAMRFIAPLIAGQLRRDVLVNVMFDHINRFKDDPRAFLREQMREFFGLGDSDLPDALSEGELFALYRAKLKELCGVQYAADLAIPHPTDDRTKFRLVVGGSNSAALELFREIEKKVIGTEAALVREDASTRKTEDRTGQLTLALTAPATDPRYDSLHDQGLHDAPKAIVERLAKTGPMQFAALWPEMLEAHHITKVELAQIAWALGKGGEIDVTNAQPRQRTMNDNHVLRSKT